MYTRAKYAHTRVHAPRVYVRAHSASTSGRVAGGRLGAMLICMRRHDGRHRSSGGCTTSAGGRTGGLGGEHRSLSPASSPSTPPGASSVPLSVCSLRYSLRWPFLPSLATILYFASASSPSVLSALPVSYTPRSLVPSLFVARPLFHRFTSSFSSSRSLCPSFSLFLSLRVTTEQPSLTTATDA